MALPNGSAITNAFDSVARLTGTWLKKNDGTILNSHAYGYNLAGQRAAITNIAGNYLNYTYDNIGQLGTAKGKESGGSSHLHEQFGYAYDAAGNLNYRTNNALVQTFTNNSLNELTTIGLSGTLTVAGTTTSSATNVTVNSLTGALYADRTFSKNGFAVTNGNNAYTAIAQDSYNRKDTNSVTVNLPATVGYVYDLNGNLTSDGTRGFEYDDENQLVRVTVTNSWKSEFTYDGKFRRRIRKEFAWSGSWVQTGEVHYIYDAMLVIQERDGNNLAIVTYTRGRDLSGSREGAGGIGGLLSRTDAANGQTACYHADGNGNVTTMVNAQQVVAAKYTYDPFGNILSKAGPLADANAYRLSSQEYHQPSGLSLYLYRAYDPNLQRWLNRDPIGEVGFHLLAEARQALVNRTADDFTERLTILLREPGGPNLYAFNGNDPLDYVDPLGLLKFESCSAAQQAKLTADFNAYCGKLKNSLAGCCKNSTILPKLENICKNSQDFTIKCESSATGKCDGGTCGWSVPGGKTVHFCPGGWNSQTCGPLGCTVMHEFTHIIGHPFEKWPKQVEKCLGCP